MERYFAVRGCGDMASGRRLPRDGAGKRKPSRRRDELALLPKFQEAGGDHGCLTASNPDPGADGDDDELDTMRRTALKWVLLLDGRGHANPSAPSTAEAPRPGWPTTLAAEQGMCAWARIAVIKGSWLVG